MKRSLIAAALALAAFSALSAPAEARRHKATDAPTICHNPVDAMRPCPVYFSNGMRAVFQRMQRGLTRAPAAIGGGLVDRARAFMGTNPTGWRRVWCGRFMAMIAPAAAAKVRNPNRARDWLSLPRAPGAVGDIVVLSRGRGGHIGVLSGFDKRGNPIVVSGNHGHVVGEGVYPRSRVIAFVQG